MREKLVWKAKVWKCLKVVVFVCKVIPSVQVYLINECETELYWIIGQDYWWNYLRPVLPILYRNAVLCLALSLCRNRFLSASRQENYSAWPTNVLIAYRALIWSSFLSTHAFLLGNGQTYATLGVPYYCVSRIFMSRIFSVPLRWRFYILLRCWKIPLTSDKCLLLRSSWALSSICREPRTDCLSVCLSVRPSGVNSVKCSVKFQPCIINWAFKFLSC